MKKSDLKAGMIIELREGAAYMVMSHYDSLFLFNNNGFTMLSNWNDDLINVYNYADKKNIARDIVKIRKPETHYQHREQFWKEAYIIWERTESVIPEDVKWKLLHALDECNEKNTELHIILSSTGNIGELKELYKMFDYDFVEKPYMSFWKVFTSKGLNCTSRCDIECVHQSDKYTCCSRYYFDLSTGIFTYPEEKKTINIFGRSIKFTEAELIELKKELGV